MTPMSDLITPATASLSVLASVMSAAPSLHKEYLLLGLVPMHLDWGNVMAVAGLDRHLLCSEKRPELKSQFSVNFFIDIFDR